MQIFELHFNPQNKKEDRIFDSFVYEPETAPEKKLGSLYIVGEFQKPLPQNSKFLDKLANVIKKEYYAAGLHKSCEQSLKEALKKANEFLDKEARKGNVNWLGNLHFAVLNFKDFILSFTKVGGVKILLSREGEFLDVGHNLEFQQQDPYPLKVFGSVATGKLAPDDKIILLTKEMFSVLTEKTNFLSKLRDVSDEKQIKKILKEQKSILSDASGICMLLLCGKEQVSEKVTLKKKRRPILFKLPKIPFLKISLSVKAPSLRVFGKNKILLMAFLFLLAVGFLTFHSEPSKNPLQIEREERLRLAESKISMAENFLIFKEEEKAKELFLEAQDILKSLDKQNSFLSEEAASLQEIIEGYLEDLKE